MLGSFVAAIQEVGPPSGPKRQHEDGKRDDKQRTHCLNQAEIGSIF
jgi:hypothetical protein